MTRLNSRLAALAVVLASVASTGLACPPLTPGGEGDDELAGRIDDAMAKVRPDLAWRSCGATAAANPVALADWRPRSSPGNGWQFAFTPFFWAPAMHGSVTVGGQTVDVDNTIIESLEGVFDNFEFAAMGRFEAHHCKWSILVDLLYLKVGNESDANVAGVPIEAEWDLKDLTLQAMLGYQFACLPLGCPTGCFTPSVTFDALAGFRLYYLDSEIDLDPGPDFDESKTWVDPVVGVRALFHVTPRLTFNVSADIGGFGVGSDLSWRAIAGLDYRINRCVSIDVGWAVLDVDYEDGGFAYDVNESGPYLGATFRF